MTFKERRKKIVIPSLMTSSNRGEFETFLKSYVDNFKWKFGSTKDVCGLLSYMTKKDWKPWFEENYWGTGLPEVKK